MELFSLTIPGYLFWPSILPCTTASVEIYNLKVTPLIFYVLCFDPWLKWSLHHGMINHVIFTIFLVFLCKRNVVKVIVEENVAGL